MLSFVPRSSSIARVVASLILFATILLAPALASAYPWMIRHEYTGCTPCHADPTGGGLLTEYGRAQSEILLRTRYSGKPEDEAGPIARFAWGVPTPDWLLLGGSFRGMYLGTKQIGGEYSDRPILMQADLRAQIAIKRFRASGSLGYLYEGGQGAQITHRDRHNLVSREHWLGVDLGEDNQYLLRAGRLNLPFGIRSIEHTMWMRSATRTNINADQQVGLAFSASTEKVRGEIMAIAGNYFINPDSFRERGYAGFVEFNIAPKVMIGVESLVTYAKTDKNTGVSLVRQAHGIILRASPVKPLVLGVEGAALAFTPTTGGGTKVGYAAMLQADIEPVQGVHIIAAGESQIIATPGTDGTSPLAATKPFFGGWLGAAWFFLPHADVRVDVLAQSIPAGPERVTAITFLAQWHIFL